MLILTRKRNTSTKKYQLSVFACILGDIQAGSNIHWLVLASARYLSVDGILMHEPGPKTDTQDIIIIIIIIMLLLLLLLLYYYYYY